MSEMYDEPAVDFAESAEDYSDFEAVDAESYDDGSYVSYDEPTWSDPNGQEWTQADWEAQQQHLAAHEQQLAQQDPLLQAYEAQLRDLQASVAATDQYAQESGLRIAQMNAASELGQAQSEDAMLAQAASFAREAGVRDQASFERMAQAQLEAEQELWKIGLAQGRRPEEMAAAWQAEEFRTWREEGLAGLAAVEKYQAITEGTAMGRHRARVEAETKQAEALGLDAPRSIFETSPSLQRMADSMFARAERIAAEQEALSQREQAENYWHDINRDEIERLRPKTRKVVNR